MQRTFEHSEQKRSNMFLWCILAYLYPVTGDNAQRVSKYKDIEHNLYLTDCSWPMKVANTKNFEIRNNF